MIEFEINGLNYRAEKLDAFKQFHLSRKIAPVIPPLIPIFMKLSQEGGLSQDLSAIADVLEPFATALSEMNDQAAEYVIGTALSVVKRQNGSLWTPVWSSSINACAFDDMDMGVMLKIVFKVVQDNLGPFIQGLLTSQQSDPSLTAPAG